MGRWYWYTGTCDYFDFPEHDPRPLGKLQHSTAQQPQAHS